MSPQTMIDADLTRRYQFGIELAPGRGSRVFRASQPPAARPVAVTLLSESNNDSERLHRFLFEAENRGKLRHPHIVELYDYGVTSTGERFYVTEWIEGPTLSQLLANLQSLPVERLVRVALQVGRALREGHDQGIVHGDLTPDRIWFARLFDRDLVEDDFIKVTDFGWVTEGDHVLTPPAKQARDEAGSESAYDYRAPEQIRGQPSDAATDIYNLGALLFHALTGRPPFLGSSDREVADQHLHAEVPRIRLPRQTGAAELDVVCRRCLAKDPRDRYPGLGVALRDLQGVQRLIAMTATPPRVDFELSHSVVPPEPESVPATAEPEAERSSRSLLLLVVLLCAVGTALFWSLVLR